MVSRRRFLQANAIGLALPLAASRAQARVGTPKTTSFPSAAKHDYWNDWPLYLTAKVNEARAQRKAALASLRTAEQAQERLRMLRARVWELIGGPLERTPLNPRTAGTIERTTYRIEKVIFESQPLVYVTAHLYVPSVGQAPFPGILAPLGHASNGKAYRNYQYLFQTLARKGYVVLAFDPFGQGERHQYFARTGKPRYGPTGEHSQAGRPLLLLGATFAQYRAWDGIRALDYLVSRSEVDSTRIGCTGHSGGGTMTMYLCALEPRIHAAVEVQGNSENLAGPNYSPPGAVADAEQNLIGGLAHGLDRGDLLAAFAPKPLLVCYTPQDTGTTYSPGYEEGTQEIFNELKSLYGALGAQEKVALFASPLPHDFDFPTRRATYEWFNQWLSRKDLGADEAEFETSPPEALNCTTSGEVLTSLGGRSLVQLNTDRAHAVVPPSPYRGHSVDAAAQKERVRAKLRSLLALPADRGPLEPRTLSSCTRRGVVIEEVEFRSEPQVRVPGWFLKPQGTPGPLPTILHVSEGGKDSMIEEPTELDALVQHGIAVCTVDLRGLGVTAPRFPAAGPLFYGYEDPDIKDAYAWAGLMLGKPVVGQRVWDLLRCLDYLESRPDVDRSRIHLVGVGGGGLTALLGAALDDRARAILLQRVISNLLSVVESEEYSLRLSWFLFGMLRELDLPDLVASLAPRRCWLLNAAGAHGEILPESTMKSLYSPTVQVYAKLGTEGELKFIVQPDQEWTAVVKAWMESS
jgi:cephalosporin-C deacetylase-like acetyl esterase